MRRTLASLTVAAAAAAVLTGCIPMPPTNTFVAVALPLLEDAGAVFPEAQGGGSKEDAVLALGEGMCQAADEFEGQPAVFGIEPIDMIAVGLTGALQIDGATADEFIALSFEHLCPEHAG